MRFPASSRLYAFGRRWPRPGRCLSRPPVRPDRRRREDGDRPRRGCTSPARVSLLGVLVPPTPRAARRCERIKRDASSDGGWSLEYRVPDWRGQAGRRGCSGCPRPQDDMSKKRSEEPGEHRRLRRANRFAGHGTGGVPARCHPESRRAGTETPTPAPSHGVRLPLTRLFFKRGERLHAFDQETKRGFSTGPPSLLCENGANTVVGEDGKLRSDVEGVFAYTDYMVSKTVKGIVEAMRRRRDQLTQERRTPDRIELTRRRPRAPTLIAKGSAPLGRPVTRN